MRERETRILLKIENRILLIRFDYGTFSMIGDQPVIEALMMPTPLFACSQAVLQQGRVEMKKFILVALLTSLPIPSFALTVDHRRHILVSALSFGTAYVITKDMTTSVIFGLGVGVGKEIYDSFHKNGSGFDTHDVAADTVGVAAGVLWVKSY